MNNIDAYKLILFDFDDTLCIHNHHGHNEEDNLRYHVNILLKGAEAYTSQSKNEQMQEFVNLAKDKGIRLGLISWTLSEKHNVAKSDWVFKNYGVHMENYCVGSREGKLAIMEAISEAYEIPRHQILLVDDLYQTLDEVTMSGFSVASPMEIVNYINKVKGAK